MRTVPALLQAHINTVDTTTTRLLKITLKSGATYGLAMLDRNVSYDDGEYEGEIDYIATNGFDASTISADIGYSVDNAEGYALISELVPGITTAMAEAGELDDATWVCYLVNYEDLTQGHVILDAGDLGEVRTKHGMIWIPELLSYVMRLRQPIGGVWSRTCRAIFGSPANSQTGCGIDLTSLWVSGEVLAVGAETDRVFVGDTVLDSSSGVTPSPGRVQWLTGVNAGREYAVEEIDGDEVTLSEPTLYAIEVGDTYRIRPDCKKQYIRDCIGVWANGINFKGEPYIPVGDAASVQIPGAQQPVGGGYVATPEVPVTEPPPSPEEPPAPPPSEDSEYWPNWPIMNATCVQGDSSSTILDSGNHSMLADKDLVVFQSFFPTTSRIQVRVAAITAIKALQSAPMDTKFYIYCSPRATLKTITSPGNNELEINKELIDDPVKGNENWYVHRVGQPGVGGRVENEFSPSTQYQVNLCALVAGENSLGENIAFAYWKEWNSAWVIGADDIRPHIDGAFFDAYEQRPPVMFQSNGATTVTDQDYNDNGVADGRLDFSAGANAGGRFWAEGSIEFKDQFESRFAGKYTLPNSATWDNDYFAGGGLLHAPLPLANAPYYRQWEMILNEVSNFSFGLRTNGATGYRYTGGGSASTYYRDYNIQERFVKLDADIPEVIGKGCVMMQGTGQDRVPNSQDIEFLRTMSLATLLVERAAPCYQPHGSRPFSLDELLAQLGSPLSLRSMGTLNETSLAWALRSANQSVGVARFYWAEFELAIVVGRLDIPAVGPWPGSEPAVVCTLPDPGVGKKWQKFNAATYVNPVTGRAMRGQNTTLNNGADVTTVSLRPLHFVVVRRVDV